LYRLAGQSSDLTMVNSSWTEEHISVLWGRPDTVHKIYPPCDVTEFKMIKRKRLGVFNYMFTYLGARKILFEIKHQI
jgi:hypothetical protein